MWQPIETAPQDGTWVLLLCINPYHIEKPIYRVARWQVWDHARVKKAWRIEGNSTYDWDSPPTHWMPLLEPPVDFVAIAEAAI